MPYGVTDIQPGAALDEQPYHRRVPSQDSLMQWRRVRMMAFGIEAIGVLVSVEQQTNNLRAPVLRGQGKRAMAHAGIDIRKETRCLVHAAQPGSGGQINACSVLGQGVGSVDHSEGQCGDERSSPFLGAASFD